MQGTVNKAYYIDKANRTTMTGSARNLDMGKPFMNRTLMMLMYGTVSKQNDNNDNQFVHFIVNGFIGRCCLLSYPGHLFTFCWPEVANTDRGREFLQNLRCPSLIHFQWYKDVFLLKVMQRGDASSDH
ncbi:hypothetical protein ACSBR2_004695 [Camellia fascicularis]